MYPIGLSNIFKHYGIRNSIFFWGGGSLIVSSVNGNFVCMVSARACVFVCWSDIDSNENVLCLTVTSNAGCSPRWIIYPDKRADGASQYTAATTQQQCLKACVRNTNCVAVEWSDSWRCWIHYRGRAHTGQPSVTLFEFVRQCKFKINSMTKGLTIKNWLLKNFYTNDFLAEFFSGLLLCRVLTSRALHY